MLLLQKLHGRHHNLVYSCEISISQMTMDLLLFTYMFSDLCNCQYFDRACLYIWVTRRVSCKKQARLAHLSSTLVFWWGMCFSIFIFIVFYRPLFCLHLLAFGYCIICPFILSFLISTLGFFKQLTYVVFYEDNLLIHVNFTHLNNEI